MRALKDTDLMPFGKYRGKQMVDVPAEYLLYLHENGLRKGDVLSYILDNIEVLKKEIDEQNRSNQTRNTRG